MRKTKHTTVEQFCQLVDARFGILLDPTTFRRTYAGYWQRSQGAWSWYMYKIKGGLEVGSQWPLTELLKNKDTFVFNGEEFDPS